MKMNAAVMWDVHQEWSVEEVELDGPREGEVLVSFEATGLEQDLRFTLCFPATETPTLPRPQDFPSRSASSISGTSHGRIVFFGRS